MTSKAKRLLSRPVRTQAVPFCRDPNDAGELNRLRQALEMAEAQVTMRGATPERAQAVADARQAVDEYLAGLDVITFHLRAIGPKSVERLMAEHPPSPEQIERHEVDREAENEALAAARSPQRVPALTFDPETYPAALIAASVDRIVVTGEGGATIEKVNAEDIVEMFGGPGWAVLDQALLQTACQTLNQASSAISPNLLAEAS